MDRILEENAYYPEGLKIAGLCAKAYNKLPNEFCYNGNYSEKQESGYDEFALRTYDPTIGRWLSTDPYDQFASPYVGMGNDPVNQIAPRFGQENIRTIPVLQIMTDACVHQVVSQYHLYSQPLFRVSRDRNTNRDTGR